MAQLLGVRQTASILGVHANTVRNWARKSILRSQCLPSGQLRFDSDDVARLKEQILSGEFKNKAVSESDQDMVT